MKMETEDVNAVIELLEIASENGAKVRIKKVKDLFTVSVGENERRCNGQHD